MSHAAEEVIPAATKLAAKRGFIRTTLQGYEGVLYVGVSANVALGLIQGQIDLVTFIVTAVITLLAPPIAGLRSYFNITRNGIPGDYQVATRAADSAQPEEVQAFKVEQAAKVVLNPDAFK